MNDTLYKSGKPIQKRRIFGETREGIAKNRLVAKNLGLMKWVN